LSPFQAILDYEIKHGIAPGYINYSIRKLTPNGTWHKLERGEILCDDDYFKNFKADLEDETTWREYHAKLNSNLSPSNEVPPLPSIDTETLFWTMMSESRHPDPYMYPALKKLKASGQFKLAALSNTTIFPEGHPLRETGPDDVRNMFEVFVSSAHVGMRKPNRDIYEYTLQKLREKWGSEIKPGDIVFLDDIGENLKTAKTLGMRTIRVFLGKTENAVRELEKVTGLQLLEQASRARL
jgi:epoxide hydrolase-like predicted phosphatase